MVKSFRQFIYWLFLFFSIVLDLLFTMFFFLLFVLDFISLSRISSLSDRFLSQTIILVRFGLFICVICNVCLFFLTKCLFWATIFCFCPFCVCNFRDTRQCEALQNSKVEFLTFLSFVLLSFLYFYFLPLLGWSRNTRRRMKKKELVDQLVSHSELASTLSIEVVLRQNTKQCVICVTT